MKRVTETEWGRLAAESRRNQKKGRGSMVVHYVTFKTRSQIQKESQQRIGKLLELTIQVDQRRKKSTSVQGGSGRKLRKDINQLLVKYLTALQVSDSFQFFEVPILAGQKRKRIPLLEVTIARIIVGLAKEGLIQKFRHCDCGKLFYARGFNHVSCTPICRHKKYEQTEEFKRKHREKAFETYWSKKKKLWKKEQFARAKAKADERRLARRANVPARRKDL